MKALHVFSLPSGEDERRDITMLEQVAEKFSLGRLNYYDKIRKGKYTFLYARFERGRVVIKHDGNIGMAIVKGNKIRARKGR